MASVKFSGRERFLVLMALDHMAIFYDGAAANEKPGTQPRRDMDSCALAARETRDLILGQPGPFELESPDLFRIDRALQMLAAATLRTTLGERRLVPEVDGVIALVRGLRGLPV